MQSKSRKTAIRVLDIILGVSGVFAIALILLLTGFHLETELINILTIIEHVIIAVFVVQELLRWFFINDSKSYAKQRWIENIIALLLIVHLIFPDTAFDLVSSIFPQLSIRQVTLLYLAVLQLSILLAIIVKALRYNYLLSRIKLHPGAIFALSFAFMIAVGTVLLMLPKATPGADGLNFIDALFTSTSAICVTGLIVVDTATAFSAFGKLIILGLIQVGGLGIMTLTTFFAAFFAGGMSYKIRIMIKDMLSHENISEVSKLLLKILLFTLITEGIGAVYLYFSMGGTLEYTNWHYVYISVFHSVSAFCNAGFSLYPDSLMNPEIFSNYMFLSGITVLIIIGGLGFAVLSDIVSIRPRNKKRIRYQLSLHTKIILSITTVLIFGGTIMFMLSENSVFSSDDNFLYRAFHSLFLSVTSRTAGFNTMATEQLALPTALILLALMWIGAAPGSTGGGIKSSTFAITLLEFFSKIRGKQRVEVFRREIDIQSIHKAFMVIFASIFALGISSILLIWMEPGLHPIDLIFEATSAISTVGLSRDVTFHLGTAGKIIIIILMFIGRIGVLAFFTALFKPQEELEYSLPKEKILVG